MPPKKDPLVSIALTCYNGAKFLPLAIESIARQTYRNYEIVFVDDCSTDNSVDVAKEEFKRHKLLDKVVKFICFEENYGYGRALKTAIESGSRNSKYIARLDSDDALLPEAITFSVAIHEANPQVSMTHSNRYFCNKYMKVTGVSKNRQLRKGETILDLKNSFKCSHFCLYKRDMYNKTPRLNPTMRKSVDKDLHIKMEEVGPVMFIKRPLYLYRKHSENISHSFKRLPPHKKAEISNAKKRMYDEAYERRKFHPNLNPQTLREGRRKSIPQRKGKPDIILDSKGRAKSGGRKKTTAERMREARMKARRRKKPT